MNYLSIKCPSCGKRGKIKVSEDLINSSPRGIISINIANDIICSHSFIAYIDKNLHIRDYFFVDFSVNIPEISLIDKVEENFKLTEDIIDIDLIKLNLSRKTLTYTIKSIFLKQKIALICDEEFLYKHIKNFFHRITQNNFEIALFLIKNDDYKINKKNFKDAMVFKTNEIIRNHKNLINPKKLNIEKRIIEKFFSEPQFELSYYILKNEIFKAYELARLIKEHFEEGKENGTQINIFLIQKELEKKYNTKIDNLYLGFLIDIVVNYFNISVPSLASSLFDIL